MIVRRNCSYCQGLFRRSLSPDNITRGKGKYCSLLCSQKHFTILRKEGKIKLNLEGLKLGRLGNKQTEESRKKISASLQGKTGSLARNWKGGIYLTHEAIRRSPLSKQWSRDIFKRDNCECQMCGPSTNPFHANHIKKFSDYPDLRFELTNGITLCKNCHEKKVNWHEKEWESYFIFNLKTRGFIEDEHIPQWLGRD